MPLLKISQSLEGKFSVSKWLKHQVLLDSSEVKKLCQVLDPFFFFNVSEIKALEDLEVSIEEFQKSYDDYIGLLKEGKVPHLPYKSFSSAMTVDTRLLYAHEVKPGKFMSKGVKPWVQMQQHRFFASKISGAIQPMVLSGDSIHWGVQFSYPQIFFDATQNNYRKVSDAHDFPNTTLFSKLIKWLRSETVPTTFLMEGKKVSTPLRLGKGCLNWINHHPQLKSQGLSVYVY